MKVIEEDNRLISLSSIGASSSSVHVSPQSLEIASMALKWFSTDSSKAKTVTFSPLQFSAYPDGFSAFAEGTGASFFFFFFFAVPSVVVVVVFFFFPRFALKSSEIGGSSIFWNYRYRGTLCSVYRFKYRSMPGNFGRFGRFRLCPEGRDRALWLSSDFWNPKGKLMWWGIL